jgi:hypothetical protein
MGGYHRHLAWRVVLPPFLYVQQRHALAPVTPAHAGNRYGETAQFRPALLLLS